jgi:hypothetical protein
MMGRGSMMKELTGGRRKRSQMRKMERAGASVPMLESPRKKMASGMKAPAAMTEMPVGMKKGGMAKKSKPKMAKGGMMLIIGVGKKPSSKKGK